MVSDLEAVATDVDHEINAGESYLVDDPSAFQKLTKSKIAYRVIAQNIRSVNKNFDDFNIFLTRSNFNYDLIILTECWLQNCNNIPSLDQYDGFQTSRHINQNSGVVAYVHNSITNVSVYEPNIIDADSLVVKFGMSAFVCVYRSPSFGSPANFLLSLDEVLTNLKDIPNIYILGDLNIDISSNTCDPKSDEYLDLLATHGLLPGHIIPTREAKCLDHCFVKSKTKVLTAICDSSDTDHSCVYLTIPSSEHDNPTTSHKTVSRINYEQAYKLLAELNWNDLFIIRDPNKATELFINRVTTLIKNCTQNYAIPHRKFTFQPWITPGMLRCMRFRDTLHKRHKKSPKDLKLEITYKRYRNHCNNILHNLKNDYDRSDLQNNKKDIKKTWNVVKRVCGIQCSSKSQMSSELLQLKETPQESIDQINVFFCKCGQ
ncbi:putative tick transposon [Operophtera brumata]|uniref:Putative tick transposon n=1 Tax=Operophtera brumata TaxID=104452 RepID=A0A0L7LJF5_OPEBR|nr:putative tick transposon [Operophtera brumata]